MARDPDRQAAEIHMRIALINRFSALGGAEIEAIAGFQTGDGPLTLEHALRNIA